MRTGRALMLVTVGALLGGALAPAVADLVPDDRTQPRIAIVARGDNPIDALSSSPIAGATGGIVVLTPPDALTAPARQALLDFDPDVVILAGGTAALSDAVMAAVEDLGGWETRRVAGDDRYLTAAGLAGVLAGYGLDGLAVSDAVPANDRTTYVQDSGDPVANGQALLAAAAAAPTVAPGSPSWRLLLDPGVYDLGTEQLVLPGGVDLVGAGRESTVIESSRNGSGPVVDAAVLVAGGPGEPPNRIEDVRIRNTSDEGPAVVALFAAGGVTVRRANIGQNTSDGGPQRDSYAMVATAASLLVESTSLTGYSTGSGVGVGLYVDGAAGSVRDSALRTQSSAAGAGLLVTSSTSGSVRVQHSRFEGSVAGQGFIFSGTGALQILHSDFAQEGADGTVNDGEVTIGDALRDHAITENAPGTAECANNFTSQMTFIDC